MRVFKTRNDMLLYFAKDMRMAELGVFKGEFSKILHETCQPSELHLVDLYEGIFTSGDKDGKNYQTVNLKEEMDKISIYYSDYPEVRVVKSSTNDFLNSFEDEYFDFIYIDADHSYEGVTSDLELSYQKIKSGGFICGHDYIVKTQCAYAVDNFCIRKKLEIEYITQDGCPSFCIIKK